MLSNKSLREFILDYTFKYDNRVSACGVRYGSVLYLAFGKGVTQAHPSRATTIQYPVEMEVGSDNWILFRYGASLVDSEFKDIELTRSMLNETLVGRELIDLTKAENESELVFDNNLVLKSCINAEPASGFLYSFQAKDGPTWETVDAISLK